MSVHVSWQVINERPIAFGKICRNFVRELARWCVDIDRHWRHGLNFLPPQYRQDNPGLARIPECDGHGIDRARKEAAQTWS